MAKRVPDALDLLESDAEALPACFFEAKQRRRPRKAVKKIQVYSEDDEETPEKIMHLEAEKRRDEEDLRSRLHREKMESTFKDLAETKKKLAETEAKLAETQAKLDERDAELDELVPKYDKLLALMHKTLADLHIVRETVAACEAPKEIIERDVGVLDARHAELEQLLKQD